MTLAGSPVRWYVRLEPVRPAMFGDRRGAELQWAAFPYAGRHVDGEPKRLGGPTFFPSRGNAIAYARARAAQLHGHEARLAGGV